MNSPAFGKPTTPFSDSGPLGLLPGRQTTVRAILHEVVPIDDQTDNEAVAARFAQDPELESIPVVRHGKPLGLVHRQIFSDAYARPFRREIYGRRSCLAFMDPEPLSVDQSMTVQELGLILARAPRRPMHNSFVIVSDGRYLGLGDTYDLIGLLTEMQISAARHANPLTQLPGNVPINDQIDHLLAAGRHFVVCYADLDNFKPFNDSFGYQMGDDVILALAEVIVATIEPTIDFVGHIGGDDFMVLLQSPDWLERSRRILEEFDRRLPLFFPAEDLARGGFLGENRRGETVFHPLTAVSLGIVPVEPGSYESHRALAPAAAHAKKLAKKQSGSSLFIERRRVDFA